LKNIPFSRLLALALIYLLRFIQALFIISAVASWIPPLRDTKLIGLVRYLISPLVAPFRQITSRIGSLRNFPLDISFLLAFLTIELLIMILTMV